MAEIIISSSLLISVVLAVASISGYISERSGIINIGLNGFMTIGALIYSILAFELNPDGYMQIPAILIAIVGTGIFSFAHSFACINLKANQTISGTAINLLASGIALFLVNVVYKKGSLGLKSQFDYLGVDKAFNSGANWLTAVVIMAILLIVVIYLVMKFTRFGLRLKASGENPHALASQGVSVTKIRYSAVFISGLLAGLAGGIFAQSRGVFFGDVSGYGWIAIAILIAGQWKIPLLVIASVGFGFLNGFYNAPGMPSFVTDYKALFQALPFIISLFVLVFTSKWSQAPKAVGIPYERSDR